MGGREPDLVAQARGGDPAAFERLALLHKDRIYNYVLRMIGDATDAEDLTQEVFLRAFLHIRSFRGAASFSTWLYRIASNICVDALRQRRRVETRTVNLDAPLDTGDDEVSRQVPDNSPTPDQALQNRELHGKIQEAIASLSDKLREVVVLYDIMGVPYEEISQIVGCPLGTVKSRLFNARMQLRDTLKPYISDQE